MSLPPVAADRSRSRSGVVLLAVALFVLSVLLQYAGAMAPQRALGAEDCDAFAIFTTDPAGNTNNQNHYDSKPEVYLNGGPESAGSLSAGTVLYYQVQEPDGTPLMEIRHIALDSDGKFRVQLYPFDTTSNPGGEYKVVVSTESDLSEGGCTKSDNFKVDLGGNLKVTKDVEGGPAGFSGDFAITVDCGDAGTFHKTIHFPDPGFVVIDDIDAKAECHVSEGTLPDAPTGFEWGDPTFHNNNVTIESKATVTVGITNHLNETAAPGFTVDKGVSLSADGPFAANLNTTVGTTVHYRITLTNTGNVALTGVTLSDNHFDLSTKCDTPIPTTLAVGAHYDCNYTDVAVAGTTTNVATGDTAETDSDTGTATVVVTTGPRFTVDKQVSLSAAGPFVHSLTTTVGQTVTYRITLHNTGTVPLTGVTLTDNHFDLVAEGCTDIPTTLAVGAVYHCIYTDVAVAGTTTNIATGDTAETGPDTGTATVIATTPPATGSLTVTKAIPGVAADFTGTFGIRVTCTGNVQFDRTIDFPNPGSVTITGIPAGASCLVIETSRSAPPAGSDWAGSIITGPVTIDANATAALTVTNLLTAVQANETLSIVKTNNAPLVDGLPTAKEGDTVTFNLAYTVTGTVHNGMIVDTLPAGLTYVSGSASGDAAFTFQGYDATARTLTWTAATVGASGHVTYQAKVAAGAAARVQPLVNIAVIDSDETDQGADDSSVFVSPPVLAETAPPTDVAGTTVKAETGSGLPILFGLLAALVAMVLLVTPAPKAFKRRSHRD
ncbi:MAG: hypothetical protein ACJ77Y_00615 [Chloroflexota bacterium]